MVVRRRHVGGGTPLPVGARRDARRSLMVVLGRRLFDRWVGLASGLLVVTSPFVVQWSQQTRGYTMLLALVIGTTLLLLRALERQSRHRLGGLRPGVHGGRGLAAGFRCPALSRARRSGRAAP